MNQVIYPSSIKGNIQAPASKSVVQRVLAAALLSNGTSVLNGYTSCDDAYVAMSIIKHLGAIIHKSGRELKIEGCAPIIQQAILTELHCGESGLSSRLFAPISVLFSNNVELQGEGSLIKRPFNIMDKPFKQLNVNFESNNGFLPLRLIGQLKAGRIQVDGSTGSQFISGLLMTLPLLAQNSVIEVSQLQSKPYIDLTIEVLKAFGVEVEHTNYEEFYIRGNQQYTAAKYNIEGDWSGASCLLVAGAVAGHIEVSGLKAVSQQADKAILDVLKLTGATVTETDNSVTVTKNNLHAFEFDATHCPDLFPALAVLAANCKGISYIDGTKRLVNKESNRALTLQTEMANIGVKVEIENNRMLVYGDEIYGGDTFAHNDHRIAMAMAVAGLTAKKTITIAGTECVNKSYPNFFDDLQSIIG